MQRETLESKWDELERVLVELRRAGAYESVALSERVGELMTQIREAQEDAPATEEKAVQPLG